MPEELRLKAIAIFLLAVGAALSLGFRPLSLGLDLRGGAYMLLQVNTEDAVEHEIEQARSQIKGKLKEEKVAFASVEKFRDDEGKVQPVVRIRFEKESEQEKALKILEDFYGVSRDVSSSGDYVEVEVPDLYLREIRNRAVEQTIEVILQRIDELKVAEPQVHRQGADRIVIQLPGQTNPMRAEELFQRAAKLEFMLVKDVQMQKKMLLDKLPGGKLSEEYVILPSRTKAGQGGESVIDAWYLLETEPKVDGSLLADARMGVDEQNLPAVNFSFNDEGAQQFGDLTGKNIGRQLAIVLDGVVKSAPNIKSRITYRGQITGNFTQAEATDLAIVLRSGPLPVRVTVAEKRHVGPSLGHDSIEKGKWSMIIGSVVVLVFMLVYYELAGVVASIALLLNVLFIMGSLALIQATLTLPGIAGLILTVGMAVDGNIIIYERIREELRAKKTVRAAIEAGYEKAASTIFDANITTAIAGVVLFTYGTGPVQGFAVMLTLGIIWTLVTSLFVTKFIFQFMTAKWRMRTLRI